MSQVIEVPEGLIKPSVDLVGEDGNAFAIMGRVQRALRQAGNDDFTVMQYCEQATAGDYNHLLQVTLAFTEEES